MSSSGTTKDRMLIDGGKFVCDNPAHPHFETDDPVEWDKHRTSPPDTLSGETVCPLCGNQTQFSHGTARNDEALGVVRPSILCNNCKAQIAKEMASSPQPPGKENPPK